LNTGRKRIRKIFASHIFGVIYFQDKSLSTTILLRKIDNTPSNHNILPDQAGGKNIIQRALTAKNSPEETTTKDQHHLKVNFGEQIYRESQGD
jgi:hypothetical protein